MHEKDQKNNSLEPEFRLFEELFGCRLCVHDYGGLFFRSDVPLLNRIRTSHRRTFPEQCGRESRRYCLAHCNDALNQRIAQTPPREIFFSHCRSRCFELAAPVYRHSRCILIVFAGLLNPAEKEKIRRIALMLPVFAAGIEAKLHNLDRAAEPTLQAVPERVKEYIAEHYMEKISTADAAKTLFLSVSHLCHLLQMQGTSFSDLLTEERLARARQLMRYSEFRLQEIASLCGYRSYEHFCRLFKNRTGVTPALWRADNRKHSSSAE